MEETALAFTDFASYCLTNILLLINTNNPWLLLIFQISLTNFKIPWLFPDLEQNSFFPDFSLIVGTLYDLELLTFHWVMTLTHGTSVMADWQTPCHHQSTSSSSQLQLHSSQWEHLQNNGFENESITAGNDTPTLKSCGISGIKPADWIKT